MCIFAAVEHQGDAGHRHGVRGAHRGRRDAIQQHQNGVREDVIQARDGNADDRRAERGCRRRHRVAS